MSRTKSSTGASKGRPAAVPTTPVVVPETHSMFSGNAANLYAELQRHNLLQIQNQHLKPKLEWLQVDQLEPLVSQRKTQEGWIRKALEYQCGFDYLANGVLFVAHDASTKKYYVFDGCGRLALAQMVGVTSLPCLVYDMSQQDAAYYFSYMQDRGRRSLDKETLFVNAWVAKEKQARFEGERLVALDCYIIGQTKYPVPVNPTPRNPQIKHAFITKGYYKAGGHEQDTVHDPDALEIMRQAIDMIVTAWHPAWKENLKNFSPEAGFTIRQDLYMGLITLMVIYPDFRRSKSSRLCNLLQEFLNWKAQGVTQQKLEWKTKGGNFHNYDDVSVAWGIFNEFWDKQDGKRDENWVKHRVPRGAIDLAKTQVDNGVVPVYLQNQRKAVAARLTAKQKAAAIAVAKQAKKSTQVLVQNTVPDTVEGLSFFHWNN